MIKFSAQITMIDGEVFVVDYTNGLSLQRDISDRESLELPSYGIISNKASINFVDSSGIIKNYATQRKLKSGVEVKFFLSNNLVEGKISPIGTYYADEWDYDNLNRQVSLSLTDQLVQWQEVEIPEMKMPLANPEGSAMSGKDMYEYLRSQTVDKGFTRMLAFDALSDATKTALEAFFIPYPYIENGTTLWGAWQKFCEAVLLHIYQDDVGNIVCVYSGGN